MAFISYLMKIQGQLLKSSRDFRSHFLSPIAGYLRRLGVPANLLTLLSLFSGLLSVLYVFGNHLLFVMFGAMHLFFDSLDGVVARGYQAKKRTPGKSKNSKVNSKRNYGSMLDSLSDSIIATLLLLKAALVLGNPVFFAAVLIYFLQAAMFFAFDLQALFSRSILLAFFSLGLYSAGVYTAGILALLGFLGQLYQLTFFILKK